MCRGKLHDVAVEKWQIVDDGVKQNLARMASTAAWGLGQARCCTIVSIYQFSSTMNSSDTIYIVVHKKRATFLGIAPCSIGQF